MIYDATIPEESAPGVSVVTVRATDQDSAAVQSPMRYSLDARGKKFFKINEVSGKIETSGDKLDREMWPYFVFPVYVSDGKHRGEAKVRIKLTDINDNAPMFPSPPYIGYVFEHQPKDTSVMVVQAIDRDEGVNSAVTYSLVENPGGRFKIDNKGYVTTTQELDREKKPNEFIIAVKATDRGNPSKSGTTKAKVIVSDANDNKPKFTKDVYTGAVSENALPGHFVTKVSATDADEGVNAELEFSIIKGNDPYIFYIDPKTGHILVSGLLDYDKGKRKYDLTVIVRDRGLPSLEADKPAHVLITIGDANDNPPVFVPSTYNKRVAEDFSLGTTLLKVTAVDQDTGSFATFNFSITGGDDSNTFGIKADSKNASIGLMYALLPLDREAVSLHNLTITATDLEGLTGTASVYLTITDVNDNGPWFIPPYIEAKIKENVKSDQYVTDISAIDPDESNNGPPFAFEIVNDTSRFKIQRKNAKSAEIHASGSFDRDTKPQWTLKIKGTDSGSPQKSNTSFVYIEIMDDNDNEPFDGELTIIVNAYQGDFAGGVIGKAYYKDEDYDGDVNKYKITSQSSNYFTIDSNSGNITAKKGIPVGSHSLSVDVTEQNRNSGPNTGKTVTSKIKVIVRSIPQLAVKNSVAVQFLRVRKVSYLVGDFYTKLLRALAHSLSVSEDRVLIFSIQKAPKRHLPDEMFFAVEIQLAVEDGQLYLKFLDIVQRLVENKERLENLGKFLVTRIIFDCCCCY